jgi:hypothetical protein
MKNRYLILIFFVFAKAYSQQLTGPQLLDKAIAYHDPKGKWPKFIGNLEILTIMPEGEDRTSYVDINLPAKSFELISKRGDLISEYRIFKDSATVAKLDLSKPDSTIATTDEDFKRAIFMRDYYTYLYGLPMKLKDPGTIVSYEVQNKKLNKKDYLVLQVNYKAGIGSDVWFFYFDPIIYRMDAYQFYREKENRQPDLSTGEYIILSCEYKTNGILMPKVRKWYNNKDKKYLATDTLID